MRDATPRGEANEKAPGVPAAAGGDPGERADRTPHDMHGASRRATRHSEAEQAADETVDRTVRAWARGEMSAEDAYAEQQQAIAHATRNCEAAFNAALRGPGIFTEGDVDDGPDESAAPSEFEKCVRRIYCELTMNAAYKLGWDECVQFAARVEEIIRA